MSKVAGAPAGQPPTMSRRLAFDHDAALRRGWERIQKLGRQPATRFRILEANDATGAAVALYESRGTLSAGGIKRSACKSIGTRQSVLFAPPPGLRAGQRILGVVGRVELP